MDQYLYTLDPLIKRTIFTEKVNLYLDDEKRQPRLFSRIQKDVCWDMASRIPGRDPWRWRFDAIGNPVLYSLRGCKGALCHEYDHIWPHSKGGRTRVLENCQVLQGQANRKKGNKTDWGFKEMRMASKKFRLSHEDMDSIEIATFGDVRRVKLEEIE